MGWYYSGRRPVLQHLATEVLAAIGYRLRPLSVPWPRLVVDAVEQRPVVTGFRLGEREASADLWGLWQAIGLNDLAKIVHSEALTYGSAYLSGGPVAMARRCSLRSLCSSATCGGTSRRASGSLAWSATSTRTAMRVRCSSATW